MDFEDGLPLDTFLARCKAQGQPLKESELRHLLRPLLEGLATVHAEDVLHRDIKLGNVFVRRRDGQPVLLDFGAAKEDFSKHSRSRAPHMPGYAAPEQVEDEGHLGPWTDVYAVGALMWRVVTGSVPPKVEKGGYCLWSKRLERGQFQRFTERADKVPLNWPQLQCLIEGLDWKNRKKNKRYDR